MTIRIEKESASCIRERVETLSGVDLSLCFQCRKCSSGCPVVSYADSTPAEIVQRLRLGTGNEILNRDIIWLCASCETCHVRCPMGIDISAVMDALRAISREENAKKPQGNQPLFNRAFLETVRLFGRSYDLATIAVYKLGTLKLLQDTGKFPSMLKKGKIALIPSQSDGQALVKRIFDKIALKRTDTKL